MVTGSAKSTAKSAQRTTQRGSAGSTPARGGLAGGPFSGVLALQSQAGNAAVNGLLRSPALPDTGLPAGLPPSVRQALAAGGGFPLDSDTRQDMESRFGADFSSVRVHTDGQASDSARSVNASAYTVGRHVVFGAGRYTPGGTEGRRLLAHELAHVVQQSRGGVAPELERDAAHEKDASQAATAVVMGQPTVHVKSATRTGLARDTDPEIEGAVEGALKEKEKPGEGEAIKPTEPGKPANVGSQKALTPEELIDEHVFGPRVHEEVGNLRTRLTAREKELAAKPNDAKLQKEVATLRQRLQVLEGTGTGPGATGGNVPGHGNINTRAAVQLVDSKGNIIAVERGSWHPDKHAEEDALLKLRARLGGRPLPPGTRMEIAGNQVVCSEVCKPAIKKFAEDYGVQLTNVTASVKTRPKIVGQGDASGKTTERTGLRSDVPKATVKTQPLFETPTTGSTPQGKGPASTPTPAQQQPPAAGKTAPNVKAQTPGAAPTTKVEAKAPPVQAPGKSASGGTVQTAPKPASTPKPTRLNISAKQLARIRIPGGIGSVAKTVGAAGAVFILDYLNAKIRASIAEMQIQNKLEAQVKTLQPQLDALLEQNPKAIYLHYNASVTVYTHYAPTGEDKPSWPLVLVAAKLATEPGPVGSKDTGKYLESHGGIVGWEATTNVTGSSLLLDVEGEREKAENEQRLQEAKEKHRQVMAEQEKRQPTTSKPAEPPKQQPSTPSQFIAPPAEAPPSFLPGAPQLSDLDRAERNIPQVEALAKRLLAQGTELANQMTAGPRPTPETLRGWLDTVKAWQSAVDLSIAIYKKESRERAANELGRIRDEYGTKLKPLLNYLGP